MWWLARYRDHACVTLQDRVPRVQTERARGLAAAAGPESISDLPISKKCFMARITWNSHDSAVAERRSECPAGWNRSNRSIVEKSGLPRWSPLRDPSGDPQNSPEVRLKDWLLKSVPASGIPRIQAASAAAIFIITHSAQSPIGIQTAHSRRRIPPEPPGTARGGRIGSS